MGKAKGPRASPERETYYLTGPEDFDEYMERIASKTASPQEEEEFVLRIIQNFVDSVNAREKPRQLVMDYLATRFERVLQGGEWARVFPLPWIPVPSDFSRAKERARQMACDIENARRENPAEGVTGIIERVAEKWNVSYETARANYYEMKPAFSKSRPKEIE